MGLTQRRDGTYTPCNGVCIISQITHRCRGCERTRPEIRDWRLMTQEQRKKIMNEELPKRRGPHPSHILRGSDASTFDVICEKCGATDQVPGGWGKLSDPCPAVAQKLPCRQRVIPHDLLPKFENTSWDLVHVTDQTNNIAVLQTQTDGYIAYYKTGAHEQFRRTSFETVDGYQVQVYMRDDHAWFESLNEAIFFAGVMNGAFSLE